MSVEILGKTRSINGWKKGPPDNRDYKYAARLLASLPPSVDLEAKCPPTEDQSYLGSCTANAGSSAVEFISDTPVQLSRLFLYYATRVWVAGGLATEDEGAYIRDTMKALANHGICTEALMPYNLDKWKDAPSAKAKEAALDRQILEYRRCDTLSAIKSCLADGLPLEGGFYVPENMMSSECQRTGVVKHLSPGEEYVGGHAVLFVGYDDSKQLLKFQNSWSTEWGVRGFGFLPYSFVTQDLADDFWTIKTVEVPTPTPTPPPTPKKLSWWQRFLNWLSGK